MWYNKDIKITNDPKNFHSLPGLIVKLYSEKWTYELISINYPEKLEMITPNKPAKIIIPVDYKRDYLENRMRTVDN